VGAIPEAGSASVCTGAQLPAVLRWLQGGVVLAALLVLRAFDLIADEPWWVITAIGVATIVFNDAALRLWPGDSERAVWLRIAVLVATGTTLMYVTGWGPMLVIGYAWILGEEVSRAGSRACAPALACSLVALLLGQLAIQLDIAPSFVETPEVHGLAILGALGLAFAVRTIAIATRGRERAEADLRQNEERLRSLLANSSDLIIVLGQDGVASYVSPAFEWTLGPPEGEFPLIGDLLHPDDLDQAREVMTAVLEGPGASRWTELRLRDRRGDWHWFDVWATNRVDDPSVGGVVANLRDITERKLFEEQIAHQAYHDQLTGLPNRSAFIAQVQSVIEHPAKRATRTAVLLLDIDRFKVVNDSLGHELGDRLLAELADRLRASVRPGDYIARVGGDEFTMLLTELHSPDDAVRVAQRVSLALRDPLSIGAREIVVTASIGITVHHGTEEGPAVAPGDLLRQADLAMSVAKERGRARWEVYDPAHAPRVVERLELESALWRAVDEGELVVHFQPEISLADGTVIGVEALVRWEHPQQGTLYPDAFIPFAEESNLIVAIDRAVLRVACRQASTWRDRREGQAAALTVSVNLSPRFVNQPELVDDVLAVLDETGLQPEMLQLEITERTALTDRERTGDALAALREHGIRVAIDDFGTGYSSLSYLRHFPIDVLKLDKAFVDGVGTVDAGAAIVEAVITMGHALGMRITAEGVERAEQVAELQSLGCDGAQGYHFARPLAPAALEQLLADDNAIGGTVVPLSSRRKRGTAS
jgi:diguanylate cyclase (GGDEF)-like protein/PAS domain S-box-containing protein